MHSRQSQSDPPARRCPSTRYLTRAAPRAQKKDPTYSKYSGVPIVDSAKLLSFVDVEGHYEDGEVLNFDLGFELDALKNPTTALTIEPAATAGIHPTCPDFILHSGAVESAHAYAITFGDEEDPDIATVYIIWLCCLLSLSSIKKAKLKFSCKFP